MSREGRYLPTLDGWRAVAISLVLFCHASVQLGFGRFKDLGVLGVQIFFGLSGYLITSLLLREEAKNGSISLIGFYRRRAFRILPAALTFLCVVAILSDFQIINVSPSRWFAALFFFANYSQAPSSWYVAHFWSLAVEEHFYLIWPTVLLLVRRNRLALALSMALLLALWRAIDFKYQLTWTDAGWFWGRTDIEADGLLFGCAAALVGERFNFSRPWITPVAIAIFVASFVLPYYLGWKLSFALLTVRAAIIPVMILSTLYRPQGMIGMTLELKPLRFVGLISYSLYLWQQLFLNWQPQFQIQLFPLNIALAFLCAVLSYYLIEQPVLNMTRSNGLSRIPPSKGYRRRAVDAVPGSQSHN